MLDLRNYRYDPFAAATDYAVVTDELYVIPATGTYWVRLNEWPDETYTDPTSGTPVYIRTTAGTVFTEVGTAPGLNEFHVDYTYKTGLVRFNSGNAGDVILVCYRATGSPTRVEMVNVLKYGIAPLSSRLYGDATDGDSTVSGATSLAENPAGSGIAYYQYRNLTINASQTLNTAAGVKGMILQVAGKLTMGNSAVISMVGRGSAANTAGGYGGGGGGGTDYDVGDSGNDGGGPPSALMWIPGAGTAGAGGTSAPTVGSAGAKSIFSPADHYWLELYNLMVYGAGGGTGGGAAGGAGGTGGGFIIIYCHTLVVGTTPSFDASGGDGVAGAATGGGGGGGAGGTIFIVAHQISGSTASTIETSYCDVTGGAAGAGGGGGSPGGYDGGAGSAGIKKVIELGSFNVR